MKRKVLALGLSVLMAVGLMAGCVSAASSSEAAPAESKEESVTESVAESEAESEAEAESEEVDYSAIQIGLLLSGSANDGGWSQLAADALTNAAAKYGCTTNFSESLQPTDFETTMRGYADAGYQIIVAHGAEFLDTSKTVAADYPDIQFINTSSMSGQDPNLAGIDLGSYEFGFLTGVVCGLTSENGKIGCVNALEGDTTVLWGEALKKAAAMVHPGAEVTIVYTGSYDDQLKAKQATQELINQGCDTITENCDAAGIGAIQQCTESGVVNVCAVSDYRDQGESVICAVVQNSTIGIEAAIDSAIRGELGSGAVSVGAAEGVITITDFGGAYADKLTDEERAIIADYYQRALDKEDFSKL